MKTRLATHSRAARCMLQKQNRIEEVARLPRKRIAYAYLCVFDIGRLKTKLPQEELAKKYLRALNIEIARVVWEIPENGLADDQRDPGVLATAGGMVVFGDLSGTERHCGTSGPTE